VPLGVAPAAANSQTEFVPLLVVFTEIAILLLLTDKWGGKNLLFHSKELRIGIKVCSGINLYLLSRLNKCILLFGSI
jgi:hypothetical protein